ncbi:g12399 [Coccomyxa viridis]|uniref:G12399 protein n=1 Tax=Coccomyxa viridis TaxID=1274662 RepID=A0ABP1GA88_9CHLO
MAAKARSALDEMNEGEFKRKESTFRKWIGKDLPAEAGRYHLYISYGCPWACRCLATLAMKGLEDAVGVSVVHPTWQKTKPDDYNDEHYGWTFASPDDPPFKSPNGHGSFPPIDCVPDNVNGARFIRDLYEMSNDTSGKFTVPVLWDKQTKSIVNNESADIVRMFNEAFNEHAKNPEVDIYPEHLRKDIDAVNEWIYPNINNGVYRCGFATQQKPYEEAFEQLFAALDRCEETLGKQRYLTGNTLTEADVRLFQTLIRFDVVYVAYFKCNRNFIHEMPNLRNYVRELYSIPGIARCVNIYHIKTHYHTSHPKLNYYAIVPEGPAEWWTEPHDRDQKFPSAK